MMTNNMKTMAFDSTSVDLTGRSVFVTGGTGSFGKHFVRTVLDRYKPKRLIIFSRDELKQHEMAIDLSPDEYPCLRYFIGDVRDSLRLEMAMRGVDYVVHAAALKQVPTAEYNPFECIHTNVMGAENVVNAAIRNNVKRVVALSTDKAANPSNLYGASKLASDKIFVAANNLSGDKGTRFAVVRYGNVVGSRGSVVPLFERLIAAGGPDLPITDPRMTRFWITLQQGVNFVLSSMEMMQGGEIFVPKIPSMQIAELAKAMAPDLNHRIIGIRPGEKLHEVMITEDDARTTIELDDRYVIQPPFAWWRPSTTFEGPLVPDGFRYSSDANSQWLDGATLREFIKA
jgi:UDP-N-acetylglucosamine 4,6-dehydratase/5-epimerase